MNKQIRSYKDKRSSNIGTAIVKEAAKIDKRLNQNFTEIENDLKRLNRRVEKIEQKLGIAI